MSNVTDFPKRALQPFKVIYPSSLQGQQPAPIEWMVENCIPKRAVCMFSGDSGLGKSLLALHLQTATALGKPWLGFNVSTCRSFGFYCEDPENVIQRRQIDIARHYDIEVQDLEDNVSYASRVGEDNVLMDFNRRTDMGKTTAVFQQLSQHVDEAGAQLVIIDTLAHVFNGNENIRAHVTAFVAQLHKLAEKIDGAVIINSHPSNTGLSTGTGFSGSTAWKATVRAHMYLKRPKGYDDEDDTSDSDIRVLKSMKANWGPGGGLTRLRWQDGVFVAEPNAREIVSGVVERLGLDNAVLAAAAYLIKRGEMIAVGRRAKNSFWNMAKDLPSCRHFQRGDFERAVDRLLQSDRLLVVEVCRSGHWYQFIRGQSDRKYPGEQIAGDAGDAGEAGEMPNE